MQPSADPILWSPPLLVAPQHRLVKVAWVATPARLGVNHRPKPPGVLQPVLAEVAQLHTRRQLASDEFPGRLGEQDLSPMPGRADASGPVHVKAGVTARYHGRLAGMDA